jgi:hypothetical protein
VERNALLVPKEAVLDLHHRYEEQILRKYYRARHELERMQRLRQGDEVPPQHFRGQFRVGLDVILVLLGSSKVLR